MKIWAPPVAGGGTDEGGLMKRIILRQQSCRRLGSGGRWLLTESILESSHYRLRAFRTQLKSTLAAMAGTGTPAALESAARDSDSWTLLTRFNPDSSLERGAPARDNQPKGRGELLQTQRSPLQSIRPLAPFCSIILKQVLHLSQFAGRSQSRFSALPGLT